jgi:hypothetical protein
MFTRTTPAVFAQKTGIPAGWIVVHHDLVKTKAERRRASGRWFKLKSSSGNIYRILRFSPRLRGPPHDEPYELVIDWPGWLILHNYDDNLDPPLVLEIFRTKWWEFPRLAVSHPDPLARTAGILGLVSVGLGILSVILALLLH